MSTNKNYEQRKVEIQERVSFNLLNHVNNIRDYLASIESELKDRKDPDVNYIATKIGYIIGVTAMMNNSLKTYNDANYIGILSEEELSK